MGYYQFVFSPTGGTKRVADAITKGWDNVTELDLAGRNADLEHCVLTKDDLVLIAMPSFGGLAPQIALDRLASVSANGAKCVIAAVYGNRAYEDTLVQMEDVAAACGFRIVAAISAVAEHSIIREYAAGRPDADDRSQLGAFGGQVLKKESDETPAIPGNRPYKKRGSGGMVPKANSTCTKCGLCARKCPVGAIDEASIKKADKDKCISCMRCVAQCPQNARGVSSVMCSVASAALKKVCSIPKENELFL